MIQSKRLKFRNKLLLTPAKKYPNSDYFLDFRWKSKDIWANVFVDKMCESSNVSQTIFIIDALPQIGRDSGENFHYIPENKYDN